MKEKILTKKMIIGIYGVLLLLLLAGTFWDYEINTFLYHPEHPFAIFISTFGLYAGLPVCFTGLALFLRLISIARKDVLSYVGAALSIFMSYEACRYFLKGAAQIAVVPGFAVAILLAVYVFLKADTKEPAAMKHAAWGIMLTFASQLILINRVVKTPWGRPRFRSVIKVEGMEFRPWYRAGITEEAKALMASGIKADEFKSFPSGHSGISGSIVTMAQLSRVLPVLHGKGRILSAIGLVWAMSVMLGRVVAGAHFITDVTMGFTISFTLHLIFDRLLSGRNAETKV